LGGGIRWLVILAPAHTAHRERWPGALRCDRSGNDDPGLALRRIQKPNGGGGVQYRRALVGGCLGRRGSRRCDLQMRDVPFYLQDFTTRTMDGIATCSCRRPCSWIDQGVPAKEGRRRSASRRPSTGFIEPALASPIDTPRDGSHRSSLTATACRRTSPMKQRSTRASVTTGPAGFARAPGDPAEL
jgi:hypothetical protein